MKNTRVWILGLAAAVALWGYSPAALAFDGGHGGSGHDDHGGSGHDDHGGSGHDDHGGGRDGNNQNNNQDNQNRARVSFAVQPAGAGINAEGRVEVRTQGLRERFKLEVEANAADGALFMVFVNAPSADACAQGTPLGSLQLRFGEAELEFDNQEGPALPPGISARAINSVCVVDSQGATVLSAQFGMPPIEATTPLPAAGVQRRQARLVAAPAGAAMAAEGNVDLRVQGQAERLKVEVEANAPAGTMFAVFGIANNTRFFLGTVTLRLGEGELQLENENTAPPVMLSSITEVQVTSLDGVTLILTAALPH